tara:strand:+ start:3579 stop:4349 length:771 start_codon:yes stop_codon:yes gene_type:complete
MKIDKDMSNEEYHSIDGISSSAVKAVYKKSLAHWKGQKIVQSAAFAMGNAVHANLLEADKNLVIKGPKTKTSAAFKSMKEDLNEDQVLLTEVEFNVANCITKGALDNPLCSEALNHKERVNEISIFVEDPVSGLMLKTRPDLMIESNKAVYDVKTTQDASPRGFLNECVKYGYFLQGAHYVYTCNLAGYDVNKFAFIACEKSAPFISHLHFMGEEIMEWATVELHKTLAVIAKAEEEVSYGTGWGDYTVMEKPAWL